MRLVLSKAVPDRKEYKNKGSEKAGSSYIMRVVTGKDKDGSPQYRYLRSQEEVEAYQEKNKNGKVTHEKQKEAADDNDKKKQRLLAAKKDKKEDKDDEEKEDKVSKNLVVKKK